MGKCPHTSDILSHLTRKGLGWSEPFYFAVNSLTDRPYEEAAPQCLC